MFSRGVNLTLRERIACFLLGIRIIGIHQLNEVVQQMDENGDDYISIGELIRWVTK